MSFATPKICPPAVRRLPLHAREIFRSALNAAWNPYADRGSREQGRSHVASPDGDQEAPALNRRARREIGAAPVAELLIQIWLIRKHEIELAAIVESDKGEPRTDIGGAARTTHAARSKKLTG